MSADRKFSPQAAQVKKQERGATAIEYALIAAGIAVAIAAIVGILGGSLTQAYQRVLNMFG